MLPGNDCSAVLRYHHACIIEAARSLNLVLGVAKLFWKLQKVLIRFEIRIRLGDGKERFQRTREHIFCLRLSFCTCGAHRRGTRFRHILKHTRLMRSIPLHRLDEIRDKVVTAFQLYLYIIHASFACMTNATRLL